MGGDWRHPPRLPSSEVVSRLNGFVDEAALLFRQVFDDAQPWVWSDPSNAVLLPFWSHVVGNDFAVILLFRHPLEAIAELEDEGVDGNEAARIWQEYNRIIIANCEDRPVWLLNYRDVSDRPALAPTSLAELWPSLGLHVATDDSALNPTVRSDLEVISQETSTPLKVLYSFLNAAYVSGDHSFGGEAQLALKDFYDAEYYENDFGGVPYTREDPHWLKFFGDIADQVIETLHPRTALDVGCAIGFLVEALRERGVNAIGIDISEYAISQVPENIAEHCSVATIVDEIVGQYDIVFCIEVLEHLPAAGAGEAIANLCRHGDAVFFSSTPDDYIEPTHLNVQPASYWSALFAQSGFLRDFDYDATFLAPQAVLYRRTRMDVIQSVLGYERLLLAKGSQDKTRIEQAQRVATEAAEEHDGLATRFNAQSAEMSELLEVSERRQAELLASITAIESAERAQEALVRQVRIAEEEAALKQQELLAYQQTKLFRYSGTARKVYSALRSRSVANEPEGAIAEPTELTRSDHYGDWLAAFEPSDVTNADNQAFQLPNPPLISVLMPVYNTPPSLLRAAVTSVTRQRYTHWELCIADDSSEDEATLEALQDLSASDDRIRIIRRSTNGHISAASNSALEIATGEWVALLDHDDELSEHALSSMATAISNHPDAVMLYSDEDKIDLEGHRSGPFFKVDFDPLLLMGQNYLCHFAVMRASQMRAVGGFREGLEGSQDWDLFLRLTEKARPDQVVHVPRVLYHWRMHPASTASALNAKPYAVSTGGRAVEDHLQRIDRPASVITNPHTGWNQVSWSLADDLPLVTIVIPTRDGKFLRRCFESLTRLTTYSNYEIVVVDNGSETHACLQYLHSIEGAARIIRDERPFNYSALNNMAVGRSRGELVCLMNDDTEVLSSDWLNEMVGQISQPGTGIVGAKLYYPNGLIQHSGVVLGIGGVAGHIHRMEDRLTNGYFGRAQLAQHMSAVTAACMLVRRSAWDEAGGLDEEHLAIAFNDIDFCLRVRELGWEIVFTPFAELIHHESISRGVDSEGPRAVEFQREVMYMKERWSAVLRTDPYYNPNLSLVTEHCTLAWPPRLVSG